MRLAWAVKARGQEGVRSLPHAAKRIKEDSSLEIQVMKSVPMKVSIPCANKLGLDITFDRDKQYVVIEAVNAGDEPLSRKLKDRHRCYRPLESRSSKEQLRFDFWHPQATSTSVSFTCPFEMPFKLPHYSTSICQSYNL